MVSVSFSHTAFFDASMDMDGFFFTMMPFSLSSVHPSLFVMVSLMLVMLSKAFFEKLRVLSPVLHK